MRRRPACCAMPRRLKRRLKGMVGSWNLLGERSERFDGLVGPDTGADPSQPRVGGAAPLCQALHLRKDFDALPLQASPLVLLDPAVVFFEKQTLLVTGALLIFGKPARRFLD